MSLLDFFIFIPIVLGFVWGLFKGLIKELISLLAIVLGFFGAKMFEPQMSKLLMSLFEISAKTVRPISYILLFILIAIILLVLANMIEKLFSAIALGGLNKFLGGVFGALKFTLIISVFLNFFNVVDKKGSIINDEAKKDSIGYSFIVKLGPDVLKETKDRFFEPENVENNE